MLDIAIHPVCYATDKKSNNCTLYYSIIIYAQALYTLKLKLYEYYFEMITGHQFKGKAKK